MIATMFIGSNVFFYWLDLFVPRTRTALAQRRAFAVVGPSTWNNLPPSLRGEAND